jgi:hypothetical protein
MFFSMKLVKLNIDNFFLKLGNIKKLLNKCIFILDTCFNIIALSPMLHLISFGLKVNVFLCNEPMSIEKI